MWVSVDLKGAFEMPEGNREKIKMQRTSITENYFYRVVIHRLSMMLAWIVEEGGGPASEGSPSKNTGLRITKKDRRPGR